MKRTYIGFFEIKIFQNLKKIHVIHALHTQMISIQTKTLLERKIMSFIKHSNILIFETFKPQNLTYIYIIHTWTYKKRNVKKVNDCADSESIKISEFYTFQKFLIGKPSQMGKSFPNINF